MSQTLYIHRYRFALRESKGNALSVRRALEGFLIRSGDGFGCVHPWPELGDPDVPQLLAALRAGKGHRLLDRALTCAAEDGAARREGRSLFHADAAATPPGSERWTRMRIIPRSHATITGDADFPALAAAGFTTVKLKTHGADPALPERVAAAAAAGLKVRIDCNGTGTAMLEELRPWAKSVDFIEDPEPYDAARWRKIRQQFGFRLALDRVDSVAEGHYDVKVLKPALETCEARNMPVVITSYMDHPLGQMRAALEAARYKGAQLEAGLLTHVLFEPDAFTEAVRAEGPQLLPPDGTGLGFDMLLESLPWERLSGAAAVDCGDSSPLSVPRLAAVGGERMAAPKASDSAAAGCGGEKRQQAAAVHGGCATDFAFANFWESKTPLLLTNPRIPLDDPPQELPDGCLVFATSGSTGEPSLVCLTRKALLANAAAVNAWIKAAADDVWLRVLPVFHVGGMSIHARASMTNSRVVCDDGKWNAARFVQMLEREHVTLTSLVPAQVFDFVAAGLTAPCSLRAIIVGGGRLDSGLNAKAHALGWPLLPSYGMTEASSQVATARPGGDGSLELLPCWEARVDDDGRLQLRGAPLLSGCLRRTENVWQFQNALDAGGWFTTNDRAAIEGRILTPLGRCDRTLKILGELVDLDTIEAALMRAGMPPDRGVVIAVPDERAGMRPWLITDCDSTGPMIAAANAELPPFAKIVGVRKVQELPRSPLGKVLRAELEDRTTRL